MIVRHVVLICVLLINELNPFKATKSLQTGDKDGADYRF